MPGTALPALRDAVFARLRGDVTLMGLVTGVFDEVPVGQAYPYITLAEGATEGRLELPVDDRVETATERRFDTFGVTGRQATLLLTIWSQAAGFDQALQILDRVNVLLDGTALTLTGWLLLVLEVVEAQTVREADGVTKRVPVRYRALVQPV